MIQNFPTFLIYFEWNLMFSSKAILWTQSCGILVSNSCDIMCKLNFGAHIPSCFVYQQENTQSYLSI